MTDIELYTDAVKIGESVQSILTKALEIAHAGDYHGVVDKAVAALGLDYSAPEALAAGEFAYRALLAFKALGRELTDAACVEGLEGALKASALATERATAHLATLQSEPQAPEGAPTVVDLAPAGETASEPDPKAN